MVVQRAGCVGIHLVESFENLDDTRFAFGNVLGFRYKLRRCRGRGLFCHTENIIVSRPKLLLLGAAFAAYGPSLLGSFHFDDYSIFTGDVLRTLATRPLTALTFWFSRSLGDRNPFDYHAIDLALHFIAVLLLYDVLRQLASERAAFIGSLIFAVHPIQSEAVNYVFARATELDTVLCLAALLFWIRGRPWMSVVWFAAALAAKEECVTFPLALYMFDRWVLKTKPRLGPIVVMLLLAFASGIGVYVAVLHTPGAPAGPQAGISAANYFLAQGPVILRYLRLLIMPWGFNVDPEITFPPLWLGLGAWLLLIGMLVLAWRRIAISRAAVWFIAGIVLLLPSSSIFPVEDLAADRRMYLPMIAFAAFVGILLEHARPAVIGAIAVVLIGLSVERSLVWRTEQSLWTDAVEKSPGKLRPKVQLARVSEPQRALELLQQARSLAPNDLRIPTEIGRVYLSTGDAAKALSEFGRALALDPNNAEALNNRGAALLALGQTAAARSDFERALKIDPCQPDARANLARLGVHTPGCE